MPDLVGQRLGGYDITALVGEGELCQLYLAHEPTTEREVALKVIYPDAADGEALLERFQRVARGVAALHHPGIAPALGSGIGQVGQVRLAYLATPFIEGLSLEEELARLGAAGRVMEQTRALDLLRRLATALDYAHHRGLRHLDLKPSNVLLPPDAAPLVTDFGLADIVGPRRLRSACPPASRPFLAPELQSDGPIDSMADVFSLGMIASQLLLGRYPQERPEGSSAPPGSPALEAALNRAVDPDPVRRYRTAGELIAALQAVLTEEAETPPLAGQAQESPTSAAPESAGPPSPPPAPAKESIRQFLVQIVALITAAMALLDKSLHAVNLLRNPLVGLAVVGVGVGAMVLSAGYVLARPGSFGRRQRTLAAAGLAATLLVGAGWGGWTIYDMTRPPKGLIVLISGFDQAPGSKSVDYARRIESGLKEALAELQVDGVYVERVGEVYSPSDARSQAAAHKAAVVIYGWYDDAGVNPSFELVRAPQQFAPIVKQATVGLAGLDRLELRVDKELREMSYIAAAAIGLAYYADGQEDQALPFFEAALRSVPDETLLMGKDAILLYRAACQFGRRAFAEAAASLEEAVRLNPEFYEARQNLAIAYHANCNLTGALGEIGEAIRIRPDRADAHHVRGLLLFADNRYDEAVIALAEAVRLAPEDGSIHLSLADVYAQMGRGEDAEAEYRLAAEAATTVKDDRSAEVQSVVDRSDALLRQGDVEGALTGYREALRQAEKLGLRDTRRAWIYRSLGMAYWEAERWDEMIAAYEQAATLDPDLYSDHSTLGIAYQNVNDLAAAVTHFETAVRLQPCNANSHGLLAAAYEAQGRVDEALEQYQAAADNDPLDFTAWNSMGIILEEQDRAEEAARAYRQAADAARAYLVRNPKDASASYMLAAVLFLLGDYEEARTAAEQAVSLSPDAASHHILANVSFALEDYVTAAREFEAVLQLEPRQSASLLGRAMAYEHLGEIGKAVDAYRELIAVDDSYYNHLSLAGLYEAKNDFAAAAAEYEATLRGIEAGDPEAETIRIARAGALSKVCRLDEARQALGSPAPGDENPSLAYLATLAALQESQGARAEAAATYTRLIEANPDLAVAHYLLAWFHYREGRLPEAQAAMAKATDLAPGWAFAWSGLGQIFEAQGRLSEAEEAYLVALERMPDDSSALVGLAAIALQRGETEAALEYAQQALAHEPGYSAVLADPTDGMRVSGHIYLAWAYGHLGKWDEADAHFAEGLRLAEEAVASMPGYPRATHQLGAALLAAGRDAEAEPYLQAAVDCDATMIAARDRLVERVRLLAPRR